LLAQRDPVTAVRLDRAGQHLHVEDLATLAGSLDLAVVPRTSLAGGRVFHPRVALGRPRFGGDGPAVPEHV